MVKLLPPNSVAIELGVARAAFSRELLLNPKIGLLFSVDRWAGDRRHGEEEYKQALSILSGFSGRSEVIRRTFAKAIQYFSDKTFHLIYIDGYAHTGQEDGQTLRDWWPKLKPGGIFAGHDYSPRFPLTVKVVDDFAAEHNLVLHLIKSPAKIGYPSWWVRKEQKLNG